MQPRLVRIADRDLNPALKIFRKEDNFLDCAIEERGSFLPVSVWRSGGRDVTITREAPNYPGGG